MRHPNYPIFPCTVLEDVNIEPLTSAANPNEAEKQSQFATLCNLQSAVPSQHGDDGNERVLDAAGNQAVVV